MESFDDFDEKANSAEIFDKAMDNIEQTKKFIDKNMVDNPSNDEVVTAPGGVENQFVGLPIESLICTPILAAARGQQALTSVYVDTLEKLAYTENNGKPNYDETKKLSFNVQRAVNESDGTTSIQPFHIEAPLMSLVPVPAFVMDELTVDFEMEVQNSTIDENQKKASLESNVNYKSWFGLNANITGKIASDSNHRRETSTAATYKIHARAVQQPPSEGMARLTALLAQAMEPLPNK